MELSLLIPARNEMFLKNTVEDILKNIEADTEIIVVLDGQWPSDPLEQNPRLTVVYLPESVGQRKAMNIACRLSKAKHVMKCDAHCSFDKGFDRKLIEDMNDNWVVVPAMKNLHAFDWVCECGHRRYQGPTKPCEKCGKEMKREMKWFAKPSPYSTSYRVNSELEFKYFGEYKQRQVGDIVDTMSLQGSCFMITRERYWDLELCDDSWGSWGGQGAEISLKQWLSGGEVKVNLKTWYAHLFRTQGGDFGFPYPNPGNEQRSAKNKLREIFLNDKWPKAIHSLRWLLDKFWPIPDWTEEDRQKYKLNEFETTGMKPIKKEINIVKPEPTKGIIFYTDNRLNLKIAHMVQKQLKKIGLPIVSASLKPMPHFGRNFVTNIKRGKLAYFTQILTALKKSKADIVFFAEHDVLYHASHFEFIPPEKDKFYFNVNIWKWKYPEKHFLKVDDCKQISGMVCYRELALNFYRDKVKQIEENRFDRHFEPQKGRVSFESSLPNIDIRHDQNMTRNRWSKEDFKNQKYTDGWEVVESVEGWEDFV